MESPSNFYEDESTRINELSSFEIMDSGPEFCFDQLAFLASTVCQTPIALISFIDSRRQWFKSSIGIELHELARYLSPCNQTLAHDDIFEIKDINQQGTYKDFMLQNGLRYYAGVPIKSVQGGYNIGTLCVIDFKPRELNHEQIHNLKVISNQITDILQIRKRYKENLERLKELDDARNETDKRLQEITHKASLRAIAELSAGLSFRIRPHLLTIQGIATETNNKSGEMELLKHSADEIVHILDSLEKFISAEKEKSMKVMDIDSVITPVLQHLGYKLQQHDIDVHYSREEDFLCIGNIAQIKEAFNAILINAIEAVEAMKDRWIEIKVTKGEHKIIISVEDSGRGISETIAPFIFQPFFTTKGAYSLGVGLALAQSLLQRHSGEIKLERAFGPTTFNLILPTP
jgi:signal transduction histidine kinase